MNVCVCIVYVVCFVCIICVCMCARKKISVLILTSTNMCFISGGVLSYSQPASACRDAVSNSTTRIDQVLYFNCLT